MEVVIGADQKVLRTKAKPVVDFDKKLISLANEMEKTVKRVNGVGLAGPQVGIGKRLFLAKIKNRFMLMANPEILSFSKETDVKEEGCLSLPNVWGNVRRPSAIVVRFQDIKGKEMTLELSGMEARIVQHENDHLNGVLFIDKLED